MAVLKGTGTVPRLLFLAAIVDTAGWKVVVMKNQFPLGLMTISPQMSYRTRIWHDQTGIPLPFFMDRVAICILSGM